jgi:signal recognition particle GTPase
MIQSSNPTNENYRLVGKFTRTPNTSLLCFRCRNITTEKKNEHKIQESNESSRSISYLHLGLNGVGFSTLPTRLARPVPAEGVVRPLIAAVAAAVAVAFRLG